MERIQTHLLRAVGCVWSFHGKHNLDAERRSSMGLPARARGRESLSVSGILLWVYIPGLFLTTYSLLITAFPPWTTQEARWAPFPAHTRPDSNRIKE